VFNYFLAGDFGEAAAAAVVAFLGDASDAVLFGDAAAAAVVVLLGEAADDDGDLVEEGDAAGAVGTAAADGDNLLGDLGAAVAGVVVSTLMASIIGGLGDVGDAAVFFDGEASGELLAFVSTNCLLSLRQ
jgi:hypothetical protein